MEAAVALRWRVGAFPAVPSDVARILRDGETTLLLMANAFDSGFSTCWPPGSRLVLDLFERSWAYSEGGLERRLSEAFQAAAHAFEKQVDSLIGPDPDVLGGTPGSVLAVAAIRRAHVTFAWVGGDAGAVVRDGRPIRATKPHTLREQYRRQHPEWGDGWKKLPNVVSQYMGRGQEWELETLSVELEPRDTVVLLSQASFRSPDVSLEEVCGWVSNNYPASEVAESLCERTQEMPFSAAAVGCVGAK